MRNTNKPTETELRLINADLVGAIEEAPVLICRRLDDTTSTLDHVKQILTDFHAEETESHLPPFVIELDTLTQEVFTQNAISPDEGIVDGIVNRIIEHIKHMDFEFAKDQNLPYKVISITLDSNLIHEFQDDVSNALRKIMDGIRVMQAQGEFTYHDAGLIFDVTVPELGDDAARIVRVAVPEIVSVPFFPFSSVDIQLDQGLSAPSYKVSSALPYPPFFG